MSAKLRTVYNVVFVAACIGIIYSAQLYQKTEAYFDQMSRTSFIGPYALVLQFGLWIIIILALNWLRHTLADGALAIYRNQTEGAPVDLSSGDMTGQLQKQAKKMERKKDFAGAAEVYETLEEWEMAGQMHSLAGQFTRAGAVFERCGNAEAAISCYEREGAFELAGNVALKDGRRSDAAKLFQLAAEQARDNNRIQRAGELYEKGGHFDRAGTIFKSLNRADDALRCFEKAGNTGMILEVLATVEYEQFLRRVPGAAELFRRCAELLAKNDQTKLAAELLDATGDKVRAAELHSRGGDHFSAAESYFAAGNKEAAEESVSRVGDKASAAEFRARLAADRGDWQAAGEFYEQAGKLPQAIDAFKKAKSYGRAAKVLQDQGRYILAAEMYSMAKDFSAAGEAYLSGRDARNAAECFETAEDLPRAIECYVQAAMYLPAGTVAFRVQDFALAIDSLQKVPSSSSDYRLAQGWLGAAFFNVGRPDMAADAFSRVISDLSAARDTLPIFYWYARSIEDANPAAAMGTYKIIQGVDANFDDVEKRARRLESQTGWHTPTPGATVQGVRADPAPLVPPNTPVFPEPPPGLQSSARLQAIVPLPPGAVETVGDVPLPRKDGSGSMSAANLYPVVGDPNRYHILEQVAKDHLVTSYKAEDRDSGRIVTLRVFDVSNQRSGHPDRIVEEARKISRLSHPNVQSVLDSGRNGLRVYISQENVEGEPYPDILRRSGSLSPKDLSVVLIQIADGLSYAHSQGIVHLGLRPTCLISRGNGIVKIVDFGLEWLAVLAADRPGATTHDPASPMALDPSYMAPEQVTGQATDARTDIYALGLVIFALTTGRSPFEIRRIHDPLEIARMQVSSGFPMPSTIRATLPEQVDELFGRCTMKNPSERFQSAEEILEFVKKVLSGAP